MTAARPKTHHTNQKRDRVGTYLKPVGSGYCVGYTVVADRFLGGKITRKQHGTLDKCLREAPDGRLYEKGGTFHRESTTRSVGAAG